MSAPRARRDVSRRPAPRQQRIVTSRPAARVGRRRGIAVRLAAALFLLWGMGFAWFMVTLAQPAPLGVRTDAVVVLTGGPRRLARGIEVLQAGAAQRMLISGVARGVTDDDLAKVAGVAPALLAARADLGFAAIDTRSNAEETAGWMARHRFTSLRLVTSAAHMRRARLELDGRLPAAVRIVPDAVPVEPQAPSLLLEYHKFVLRWVARWLGVA